MTVRGSARGCSGGSGEDPLTHREHVNLHFSTHSGIYRYKI